MKNKIVSLEKEHNPFSIALRQRIKIDKNKQIKTVMPTQKVISF